jgi:hypothetical protein
VVAVVAAVVAAPLPAALSAKSKAYTCILNKMGCDWGVPAVTEEGRKYYR